MNLLLMQSTTSKFMLIADPQFGIAEFLVRKFAGAAEPPVPGQMAPPEGVPDTGWPYEQTRLSQAIDVANELEPDFVAVLGDMVMRWDSQEQVDSVKAAFKRLSPSIPVYWVSGNHDVGTDFFSATDESLALYRQNFGPDRYTFTSGPCRFIVFNTSLFDRPHSAAEEYKAQLDWLDRELAKPLSDGVMHRMVLAHHPPFIQHIDEEYATFNLPEGERKTLVNLLVRNGVRYFFAGHTHSNNIATHNGLNVIATSAVGVARSGRPGGYRVVAASRDSISHRFHAIPGQ